MAKTKHTAKPMLAQQRFSVYSSDLKVLVEDTFVAGVATGPIGGLVLPSRRLDGIARDDDFVAGNLMVMPRMTSRLCPL